MLHVFDRLVAHFEQKVDFSCPCSVQSPQNSFLGTAQVIFRAFKNMNKYKQLQ